MGKMKSIRSIRTLKKLKHAKEHSASVPVIITDSTQINVIAAGNIDSTIINSPFKVNAHLEKMREENEPIVLDWLDHGKCYVFYEESSVLKQLRLFPYIQYGIVFVFVLIAYLLFSVTRRSEENRVWVGMSKETAHQLGTPISSLMATRDSFTLTMTLPFSDVMTVTVPPTTKPRFSRCFFTSGLPPILRMICG